MMLCGSTTKRTIVDKVELSAVEAKGDEKLTLDEAIDTVIDSSHIVTYADSERPDGQPSWEKIKFKADSIWAQVSDVSCVLGTEVLCDLLDEKRALPKFSAVVESTVSNP